MAHTRTQTISRLLSDSRYAVPLQVGAVVSEAFAAVGYSVCLFRENHLVQNVVSEDDLIWSTGISKCMPTQAAQAWEHDLRLAAHMAASNGQSVGSGVSRPRGWPFGASNPAAELRGRVASTWLQHGGWGIGYIWMFSTDSRLRQLHRDRIRSLVNQAMPILNTWASGFDHTLASGLSERQLNRRGLLSLSPTEQQVYDHLKTGATEREIADAMDRSVNTIHTHVKTIYRKKRVTSRADLLANFMSEAISDLAPPAEGRCL